MMSWLLYPLCLAQDKQQPEERSTEAIESPIRNTTTGKDFENIIATTLKDLGYSIKRQTQVGTRPNGGRHYIDLIVDKNGHSFLISLKWQQTSGTAEQKIPYEMICLSEALKQSHGIYRKAFLVLGGEGWTLKNFYLSGGLERHLSLDHSVEILSPATFIKRAQSNQLLKVQSP